MRYKLLAALFVALLLESRHFAFSPTISKLQPTFMTISADTVLFLDCDDCLYQNNWATAGKITDSIAAYTARLGVDKQKAYALYQEHGTCLKGMLAEGLIDEAGAEDYLREVHSIDYSDIQPDEELVSILAKLRDDMPTWIFTASTAEHAQRCLQRIGLSASLKHRGIVDTRVCKLETKHSRSSFEAAMATAGCMHPAVCILCDDSVKNVKAAKAVGWRTVLVGFTSRDTGEKIHCEEADFHIESLRALPEILPDLFISN
mmetsp:Transcript_1970/g.3691  ORF Transcript_1970/g.3691 Transcript_1970/m.3691 type:complete len:260 (-) Transcript_1970:27-806(-)